MRRLLPTPGTTTPEEATSGLRLHELAPPDRPYLVINMVMTADGAATVAGRTRALGDDVDREVFHGLRTQVDCVMVGAGTARIERYGRMVRDPARRERRRAEGLEPDPLACVISGSMNLPYDLPLLADADSRVLVATTAEDEIPGVAATVEYAREAGPPGEHARLAPLLGSLRADRGIRSVLCEGGPTLNHGLLEEGLVDELFLTVASKLVAGLPETPIVAGLPATEPLDLELVSCHEAASSLYLRYRILR